ncbi:MAG: DUF3817 domain-containing protein [Candidatus Saccharimonadaceae bacterium]
MKSLMQTIRRFFVFIYNKTHLFTDKEAWGVFRFWAIIEAVTWTMLISAILYRRLGLPEAPSVISFAGHIHGIAFIFYFIFVLLLARSMEWRLLRIGSAIVAGMPPYGSIIFEQVMARHRKKKPVYVEPPKGYDE